MLSVSILLVLATSGILFFVHNEGWTMSEALYWTVGTMMVRKPNSCIVMFLAYTFLSIQFLAFLRVILWYLNVRLFFLIRLSGMETWQ